MNTPAQLRINLISQYGKGEITGIVTYLDHSPMSAGHVVTYLNDMLTTELPASLTGNAADVISSFRLEVAELVETDGLFFHRISTDENESYAWAVEIQIELDNDNNENEDETMENDQPLSGHVIDYQNTEETNNVTYMVLGAVMEYLTDYASLENGATYEEVSEALDTLDENFFGEYSDYREVTEALLEAQGADPIPDWLAIDYKLTWESDLRHMLNKVGDEYNNGNGYYFNDH